ncbi:MAG: hypothetical protein K6E76_06390 [Patescibacteria group bacterium]|nr:hypothetical protein [Patescibacteria group bacterium]
MTIETDSTRHFLHRDNPNSQTIKNNFLQAFSNITKISTIKKQNKGKDYNTKMAINVPENEVVKMVNM